MKLSKWLNEKWVGSFKDLKDLPNIEVFVNPTTKEYLESGFRGFVTINGDFYTFKYDGGAIHADLLDKVNINALPSWEELDDVGHGWIQNLHKAIAVVKKSERGRDVYIGESYKRAFINKNKKQIKEMFRKAKEKNPTINFILGKAW